MTAPELGRFGDWGDEITVEHPLGKYSPDQLRDDHGRFADEGGGAPATMDRTYEGEHIPKARPGPSWDELRAAGKGEPHLTAFDTPEILGARKLNSAEPSTHLIDTPERERMRTRIANDLYKATENPKRGKEAWIILGPPAAGKSAIAEPLAQRVGAHLIDADMAKERIPEFRGYNAGAVHEESSEIVNQRVYPKALRAGHNVVLPLVGKTPANVTGLVDRLGQYGYKTHVILNDLPDAKAAARAVVRFQHTGRFVDPYYIVNNVDHNPLRTYNAVKHMPGVVDYQHLSNDVPKGHAAVVLEDSRIPAHRRRLAATVGGFPMVTKATVPPPQPKESADDITDRHLLAAMDKLIAERDAKGTPTS